MNVNQQDLKLLPHYVKKIAWGLLAVSVLIMILFKLDVINFDKEWLKAITLNSILVSLLLFALTRDKVEDELTLRIRLKSFASAFIFGVSLAIISPLTEFFISGGTFSDLGTTELLLAMFFFYFITYFVQKKQR